MLLFIKHFSVTVTPDGTVVTMPKMSTLESYLKKNYGSGYHFTLEATAEGQKFQDHGGHEIIETEELRSEFSRAMRNLETALNFTGMGHYETIVHNFASSIATEIALLLSPDWAPDSVQFETEVVKKSQENCSAEVSLGHAIFTLPRPPKTPLELDVMQYARDLFHTVLAIESNENISVLEKNLYDFLEMPAFETNIGAIKRHCANLCFLLNQSSDWDEPQKLLEISDYVKNLQALLPAAREHARRQLEIAKDRGKFYEDLKKYHDQSLVGFNWAPDFTEGINRTVVYRLANLHPI